MSLIQGPLVPRAIETTYRSIRLRSRLEAKWASFFDRCGWPWLYEPIDLDGYIPDFILPFPHGPLLVEVKPALYLQDLDGYTSKIDHSGWTHEALIVGASVFHDHGWPILGLLRETVDDARAWGSAVGFCCAICRGLSLHHAEQSFRCRVRGCYDGDGHLSDGCADIMAAWAAACNTSQWRGR